MQLQAILSVSLILFSVIDIVGSLPVIIDLKRQGKEIHAGMATMVAGMLMIGFLFFGASMLHVFGIEVSSFALAGSLIIFFIGLEMTLGIRFFKEEQDGSNSGTIVPIAFPLVAGAGTLTTILSLKAQFDYGSIMLGILANLLLVFLVLRSSAWLARKMSPQLISTLRKVFGILLIAIAFQMLRANL
ncbi:MAG: MarC family protein [Bacteroidota bacterium]